MAAASGVAELEQRLWSSLARTKERLQQQQQQQQQQQHAALHGGGGRAPAPAARARRHAAASDDEDDDDDDEDDEEEEDDEDDDAPHAAPAAARAARHLPRHAHAGPQPDRASHNEPQQHQQHRRQHQQQQLGPPRLGARADLAPRLPAGLAAGEAALGWPNVMAQPAYPYQFDGGLPATLSRLRQAPAAGLGGANSASTSAFPLYPTPSVTLSEAQQIQNLFASMNAARDLPANLLAGAMGLTSAQIGQLASTAQASATAAANVAASLGGGASAAFSASASAYPRMQHPHSAQPSASALLNLIDDEDFRPLRPGKRQRTAARRGEGGRRPSAAALSPSSLTPSASPQQEDATAHDNELLGKINKKEPRKPLRFTCTYPGCGRRFAWKWTMETHARTHLGDAGRVHICATCDKGFFTASCLRSHERIHTRKPGAYACTHAPCKKTYSTKEGLSLHIRNHHSAHDKLVCPEAMCGKSFVRQADLKLHVLRKHCISRPFPCSVPLCSKSFACMSELKRHLRFHKQDKFAQAALEAVENEKKRKSGS